MSEKLKVAVGSLNPVKIRAVERVFSRYYDVIVEGVPVKTSVGPQPVGSRDVLLGALERALGALTLASSDLGVGVEAGPIEFYSSSGFLEVEIAAVIDRRCKVSLGLSAGFELDPTVITAMALGRELSDAVSVNRGVKDLGESIGYIGYLSWGTLTRQELTEQAVLMALLPRLNGASWLVSLEELSRRASLDMRCSYG
ncbi:MAG: inosine/xanthosine triphosphatase [Acidilobaceae archaeon]